MFFVELIKFMFKLHVHEEFYLPVSVDLRKAQYTKRGLILDASTVRGRPNLKKSYIFEKVTRPKVYAQECRIKF
jgi:hypothetical protein